MLKIMAFLTKREDIETQAFIEHYEHRHVPLIRRLAPTPILYKRNYLVRGDEFNLEDEAIGFDVVTEISFPDRDAYLAWRAHLAEGGSAVAEDEERFLDRSRTKAYVVEEWVTSG
jgi:hypothetical protein